MADAQDSPQADDHTCRVPKGSPATESRRDRSAAYVRAIFNREMGVTLHNAQVGSPRDDAMRELTKTTTNLYAKRVLRELIQNAYDGGAATGAARILVRLDLRCGEFGTLYVANSGEGFTEPNVDAISNPALSNKRPGNFIGHKGLGFRSVELLSDETQIYSVSGRGHEGNSGFDGFCFRFANNADERDWLSAAKEIAYADTVVGRTHRLQLPVPITKDPPEVTAFAREGFATLVRLPLRNALAAERAQEELRLLIDERAPVTLFLRDLSVLTLETFGRNDHVVTKVIKREPRRGSSSPRGRGLSIEEVALDRRRFLVASMPVDEVDFLASVEQAVGQRHPVEKWREWEGAPVVSVAFSLTADARPGTFYAFLPMDTEAPFNGCLDAPFFPNTDRRSLDLSNPLNAFLLDSVADLCLAVAEELADANETSLERACAATDALAWRRSGERLIRACERAGSDVGTLRLPTMRRQQSVERWARLDETFDWNDASWNVIKAVWLVRACGAPMLRRGLGDARVAALREFVDATDCTLDPTADEWIAWVPALAADLAQRKRTPPERWEQFYADLGNMKDVLPRLRGAKIFCTAEGVLVAANSPETLAQRELFISPEPEARGRRRRRLVGTTLFPPASVTRRMEFADPSLRWSPEVAKVMFEAGLATEYSLAKVISRLGRLLGNRPSKTVLLASLRWTFSAWLAHKSAELEKALKVSGLRVPVVGGSLKPATIARFGAGWRNTRGDLVVELCDAAVDASHAARNIRDALLVPWESWPLRERGTAAEWMAFLLLIGVRDGIAPVFYKEQTNSIGTWRGFRGGFADPLPIEKHVGPQWRQALGKANLPSFAYQSGSYATGDTLCALPLQSDHGAFSDRAKLAYARLVVAAITDLRDEHFTTVLHRTAGYSDNVHWPSPLSAFLREAAWVPVADGDEIRWSRPGECWYSQRSEPMPRLVPRIDRSVREVLDGSAAARDIFVKHLSLGFWASPESAVARLGVLGTLLEGGVGEGDHDSMRSSVRDAWQGWHDLNPRPPLPDSLPLAIQAYGRLAPLRVINGDEHPVVFIGEGEDPALENLLASLGHHLLPVPAGTGEDISAALTAAIGGEFKLAAAAQPKVLINDVPLDTTLESERLAGSGREWLAEIAVLALEFNRGFSNRATARTRQMLHDAFKRLRVVIGHHVQVEIEGRVGDLPAELDGIVPVPHAEHPALVIQNTSSHLDWPMLARISRGIAAAVERSWLDADIRAAFFALASQQGGAGGILDRPTDEAIARAFTQPVERVREILGSLRSSSRRLLDFLVPIVQARLGTGAAQDLLNREHTLTDDKDLVVALVAHGLQPAEARELIEGCRQADNLNDLRRELGISLKALNSALAALGPPWVPLSFEKQLLDTFQARVAERRAGLEQRVRDAHLPSFDARAPLTAYVEERELGWVAFDPVWVEDRDELDNTTIDAWIDAQLEMRCAPAPGSEALAPIEDTRHRNRKVIVDASESLRKLVLAWAAKHSTTSNVVPVWRGKVEQIARAAMAAGVLDFRCIDREDLPAVLAIGGLWPAGMPQVLGLAALDLSAEDLEHQVRAEQEAHNAELKRRRTVHIDGIDIDGGAESAFERLAEVLGATLSDKAFQTRSGPARLREFPEDDSARRRKRSGGASGKDPEYMSDERRTLIGFAGEFAAYRYLGRKLRGFSDEHWISSIGRRYLALPATTDDDGFDFKVPRTRGPLHYEVKAHEGDPGRIDLERSQVAAAVNYADGKKGSWSILYVAYATDPARITVYELPNPFSQDGLSCFRPSTRQGVRLLLERE